MEQKPPSPFTRVKRMPKRGNYDRGTIHAILDAATTCHVGHLIDGRPVVIPTLHWREADHVYWHGSSASRMLRANEAGGEVCLTVTMIDGFVLARSGFHHSANYRSVLCFGIPEPVEDRAHKLAAMEAFMERLFPGRWPLLRPPTEQEIKATSILRLPIDEASAKIRTGMPVDDEEDLTWPVWAGVLPASLTVSAPIPDEHVPEGMPTPPLGTPLSGT